MSEPVIRILHTADWHLGREFHGRDLAPLHDHFFDWLVSTVEEREIDLVLMAGDIFDRALPPAEATARLNEWLARLSDLAEVVLITGNHDSSVRLSHGPLLKPGLHLRSGIESLGEPVLVERAFPLAVYPIPYLDPTTANVALGLDEPGHEAVLAEAVTRSLADLKTRPGVPALAMAHAFITGAEPSESERSIRVGGSDSVPASLFDGFDYVALGHLHRPQPVGADHIRYSGSPMPLSFSEVGGEPKSVNVIELEADGTLRQERVEIPQLVEMARIKGTLEELLADPGLAGLEQAWLEITLTDADRPDQPVERLRARFKGLIQPRFTAPLELDGDGPDPAEIEKLDPLEVVLKFIEHVRGEDGGASQRERELLERAFDEHTGSEQRV